MSKRVKKWAREKLQCLRTRLGDKCAACGSTENLEFDCIEPRGHAHHACSTDKRATFYAREMREGNIQLLCKTCHQKKTQGPDRIARADERRQRYAQWNHGYHPQVADTKTKRVLSDPGASDIPF